MAIQIDTVVIGGGAAGLQVGRMLQQRGIPFLIVDAHARVGDTWRGRYRSLRLFSPRSVNSLPGLRLDVGVFGYPTGARFGDYLERWRERVGLPIRLATRVTGLTRADDGRFLVTVDHGDDLVARRVVVAVGTSGIPVVPPLAATLSSAVRQLHSTEYRGPEQLADGPVLVVGAGNSGTDIALEAAAAGHDVTIAGRHPGEVPVDVDTPIGNILLRLVVVPRMRRTTIDTPEGRTLREKGRGHGVNLVRNTLRDLDRAGVRRIGRVTGVDAEGRPVADGARVAATTVVWCTGARPDLSWLRLDGALGADGRPIEHRGVVDAVPGLGFVGLPFQYSPASATLMGMGDDAAHVVAELLGAPSRVIAPAVSAASGS